jgi:uncharacterized protein (UPF0264 family)
MNTAPPKLLVSVRNEAEARIAIQAGAAIIDVKEPSRGTLGCADWEDIHRVAAAANLANIPCSAAFGELSHPLPPLAPSGHIAPLKVTYAKLGLAGARWPVNDFNAYATIAGASAPSPELTLRASRSLEEDYGISIGGILVDTFCKSGPTLAQLGKTSDLRMLRDETSRTQKKLALAGRIHLSDIPLLAGLRPDIFGVRSAACHNSDRESTISAQSIQQLNSEIIRCFIR